MKKILIDAFGGDHSPAEVIAGTLLALNERKDFIAVFVGKEQEIKNALREYDYDAERIQIINADDVISCEEEPTLAVRRKPNSSICVALKQLKENPEMDAFVSAGSTGGVLVGATLKLGRIQGVNRPALAPVLPTLKNGKNVILTDSGATPDCKPINLCQFALMGTVYAECLGVKNPKVALLSNGTEDEKGNALNHEVFPILKNMKGINFVGNIEARDILSGDYDVIVSDGFSGNVALKGMEGAINTLFAELKSTIYSSFKGKIAGLLLKKSLKHIKEKLDYNKKGGALFLGVNKTVIKVHGSSRREAFMNAVIQAVNCSENNLSEKIKEKLESEQIVFGV